MVFTKENQLIIIFIVFIVIVGSGVKLVKHFRPDLLMGKPDYIASKDSVEHQDTDDEHVTSGDMEQSVGTGKTTKTIDYSQDSQTVNSDTSTTSSSDSELIDLNAATVEQLQELPQIGPVMSKRIVEYRKRYQRFISIEQLMEVRGIGKKTFERLKDKVVVQ